jgi:hypothetical protein
LSANNVSQKNIARYLPLYSAGRLNLTSPIFLADVDISGC